MRYQAKLPPRVGVSVAIPTYRRGDVLLRTLAQLVGLDVPAAEILVVDQTEPHRHEPDTIRSLGSLAESGTIRWLRLPRPSIPRAMNEALRRSRGEIVLFLDDDIEIRSSIVELHAMAYNDPKTAAMVGQIIQPWEEALPIGAEVFRRGQEDDPLAFRYNSSERRWIGSVMAGNMSVRRETAVALGGFDENFITVAYRFEADFADRVLNAGYRILFEPSASLRHLKVAHGGTRSFGHHLTTARPSHAAGEYYYLLRRWWQFSNLRRMALRPITAITTRHHLRRPWWIPVTLAGETAGFSLALGLMLRGPRYIGWDERRPRRS